MFQEYRNGYSYTTSYMTVTRMFIDKYLQIYGIV